MSKIVIVGSLNLDYVIEVENMPKAGETILEKALKKYLVEKVQTKPMQ